MTTLITISYGLLKPSCIVYSYKMKGTRHLKLQQFKLQQFKRDILNYQIQKFKCDISNFIKNDISNYDNSNYNI